MARRLPNSTKQNSSIPMMIVNVSFPLLKFIYLISLMKNSNILHKITSRIGDFHDSHLPLTKIPQWFMAVTQD